jgi:hypothetical protein
MGQLVPPLRPGCPGRVPRALPAGHPLRGDQRAHHRVSASAMGRLHTPPHAFKKKTECPRVPLGENKKMPKMWNGGWGALCDLDRGWCFFPVLALTWTRVDGVGWGGGGLRRWSDRSRGATHVSSPPHPNFFLHQARPKKQKWARQTGQLYNKKKSHAPPHTLSRSLFCYPPSPPRPHYADCPSMSPAHLSPPPLLHLFSTFLFSVPRTLQTFSAMEITSPTQTGWRCRRC